MRTILLGVLLAWPVHGSAQDEVQPEPDSDPPTQTSDEVSADESDPPDAQTEPVESDGGADVARVDDGEVSEGEATDASGPVDEESQAEEEDRSWDMQSGFGSESWLANPTPPPTVTEPEEDELDDAPEERPNVIVSGRVAILGAYDVLPGISAAFAVAFGLSLFEVIDIELHGSLSTTTEEVRGDRGGRFSYIDLGLRVCRRILYGWIEPAVCVGAGYAHLSSSPLTIGEVSPSRDLFVGHALARLGIRPADRVSIEVEVGASAQTPHEAYLLVDPDDGSSTVLHDPELVAFRFGLGARVELN